MARKKKSKKLSSSVEARRKSQKSSIPLVKRNVFEVRVNRLKHQVLGQKIKTDKGVPGVSRSKSNEKRKKTLLKEYKQRFKNNAIIDRRFGEYDKSLSIEDKMLKRYALEKQRHHEKSSLYNLDGEDDEDGEMLTHFGQNLGDIENFDDAGLKLTDDEADDDTGEHFGGFLTKKRKKETNDDPEEQIPEKKLSKQEIMDQIVSDSKKKKFERQQTQERAFELTQQLDSQLRDILPLLSKKSNDKSKQKPADDYDRTVNELLFEAKAKPTDRLKTEEEIARKEKEKLEELEKERQLRMLGEENEDDEMIEQSADALIARKPKAKDKRTEVHYKDGKMVMSEGLSDFFTKKKEENVKGDKESIADHEDDTDEDETVEDDSDEDDTDEDSDNDDIFSDDEEKDSEEEMKPKKKSNNVTSIKSSSTKNDKEKNVVELPYTFAAPTCLNDFIKITKNREDIDVLVILKRIRKCHHIKLEEKNKNKMEILFDVLLDYLDYLCNLKHPKLNLVNILAEFFHELVEDIPGHISKSILNKLKKVLKSVTLRMKLKGQNGVFPMLSELIFFKLVSLLYPTSDLNHAITTPVFVLMAMLFQKGHCHTIRDVICGIFMLNILYDYIKLSKRYIPEVICFLSKLLYFAAPPSTTIKKISASVLNLKREEHSFLVVQKKSTKVDMAPIKLSECLSEEIDPLLLSTDKFRLSCIRNVLLLIKKFSHMYTNLTSYSEIFQPIALLLERLPIEIYPTTLKNLQKELLLLLRSKTYMTMVPLTMQTRKPVPLPLLEPQFDEHYEYRSKGTSGSKAQNEVEKLKYKLKKETKGAVREIRKDAHFLAKEQLKEKIGRDKARKEKVKDLERTIANERREIKNMENKGGF